MATKKSGGKQGGSVVEVAEAQDVPVNGREAVHRMPKERPDPDINDDLSLDLNRLKRTDFNELIGIQADLGIREVNERTGPYLAKALGITEEELDDLGMEDYLTAFNKFWDTVNWLMNSQKN